MRILAAVDLGSELDKIAARRARYGLPGFEVTEQLKSGKEKRVYLGVSDAGARARTFVANAKTPADVAGRLLAVAAMARYTDETAVAQSARSFYTLRPGGQLPFSDEVLDALDLCEERLSGHLLDRGRE